MNLEISFESHPTGDVLEEYAFHRLPESVVESIEEHLLVCVACQTVMLEIDAYIQAMKSAAAALERGKLPSRLKRFPNIRLAAISLAGLAAALTIVLSIRQMPSTAAAHVTLLAMRGEGLGAHVPHGTPVDLVIDVSDLPGTGPFRIELVTASGQPVWSSARNRSGDLLRVREPLPLRPGIYWVRLYSDSGEVLREFGLRAD